MKILRILLKRLGIDAFLRRKGYHYVPDYYGPAAPKMINIRSLSQFSPLANKVIEQGRTLLYYDRLYTIYQAIGHIIKLPEIRDSNIAEIGVYKGGGSYFIASLLAKLGFDSITLYCIDTFDGHASQDVKKEDPHQWALSFNDTSLESVKNYLSQFKNVKIVKGRIQEMSQNIVEEQFSFVHLDMDLYDPTSYALGFFDDRIIQKGIILVDDYGFLTCEGVKKAVDEFMSDNNKYFGIALLTGQYIMVRL